MEVTWSGDDAVEYIDISTDSGDSWEAGRTHRSEPRRNEYDYLFIEGQDAIVHPAYSAVACGILHGPMPDKLVLCHETGREIISLETAIARRFRRLVITSGAN